MTSISQLLHIRPARAEDYPQVEALVAHIWDGDDYIPRVWETWLGDPKGAFVVAERGDALVALAKLTWLGPREWWMQGMRVHPDHRQQGISKAVSAELLRRFRAAGGGLARFATASHNVPVHRGAASMGFTRQAAFIPYEAEPLARKIRPLCRLAPDEAPRVWAYLSDSAYFRANARSYAAGWTWYLFTEPRLREALESGRVYGVGGEALEAVVFLDAPDTDREGTPRLRATYTELGQSPDAARALRALAGEMGVQKLQIKTLPSTERQAALEAAGYARSWEHEIWLYALDA